MNKSVRNTIVLGMLVHSKAKALTVLVALVVQRILEALVIYSICFLAVGAVVILTLHSKKQIYNIHLCSILKKPFSERKLTSRFQKKRIVILATVQEPSLVQKPKHVPIAMVPVNYIQNITHLLAR